MWKNIIVNADVYLIKLITNPTYKFYLTDLKELWSEEPEDDETILQRFKELNPLCQTCDVTKELTNLFNGVTAVDITIKTIGDKVKFDTKGVVDDFEIKFAWEMSKRSNDKFFEEVTLGLVKTIVTLENRQERLFVLLEKKDKEKEEYIREYGEISRGIYYYGALRKHSYLSKKLYNYHHSLIEYLHRCKIIKKRILEAKLRNFLKTVKFTKEKFTGESTDGVLGILSNDAVINCLNQKYGVNITKRKCDDTDNKGKSKKLRKYNPKFLKK